jgi:hypothetical protein
MGDQRISHIAAKIHCEAKGKTLTLKSKLRVTEKNKYQPFKTRLPYIYPKIILLSI